MNSFPDAPASASPPPGQPSFGAESRGVCVGGGCTCTLMRLRSSYPMTRGRGQDRTPCKVSQALTPGSYSSVAP